jgi:serine/threonine protein kinase
MAATMAGTILGTAAYMSPEQAKGKPADRRADVWAFGVVLFEMLTGKQLFAGETAAETLASVIKEEPPFERLPSDTPPAIRNLLRRCLEKNVKRRLQHIGEARIVIEDLLSGNAPAEPAVAHRKSREGILVAIAAVAVVASLALGATLLLQKSEAKLTLEATLLPPKDHNFYESDFAISPDGKKIVFVARDSSSPNVMLWVRQLEHFHKLCSFTETQLCGRVCGHESHTCPHA